MRGVDGQRRQHREDPLLEQLLALLLLVAGRARPSAAARCPPWRAPGTISSRNSARVPLHQRATSCSRSARAPRAAAARTRRVRRRPAAIRRLRPATRTMKNSSRLVAKIARNRARSSSGSVRVLGELEHPVVEVQPGQLAVEEPVGGQVAAAARRTAARRRTARRAPRAGRSARPRASRRRASASEPVGGVSTVMPVMRPAPPGERVGSLRPHRPVGCRHDRRLLATAVEAAGACRLADGSAAPGCVGAGWPAGRWCVDGQTLDPETQLMLRLQRLTGDPARRDAADPTRPPGDGRGRPGWPAAGSRSARSADLEVPGADGPLPGPALHAARPGRRPREPVAAAVLLPRRRHGLRRPRHPRRDLPVPRRAGRRPGARRGLPARPRAPVPGGRRGLLGGVPVGRRARRRRSAPTPTGSRSAATRPAARSPRSTAIQAAEAGVPLRFQLLIYPATDMAEREREPAAVRRGLLPDQRVRRAGAHVLRDRAARADATRWSRCSSPRSSRPASRPRSSSPPASTRCATRARPTRGRWRGRRAGGAAPLPGPGPRVRQRGRGRPVEPRRRRRDRRQAQGRAAAEVSAGVHARACPRARA